MANIRELDQKINSLNNMKKVMGAMNMIATIKLRKHLQRLEALKRFEAGLLRLMKRFTLVMDPESGPWFVQADAPPVKPGSRVALVVISADKGLCGSHNNLVLKAFDSLWQGCLNRGLKPQAVAIGNKAIAHCRRKAYPMDFEHPSGEGELDFPKMTALGRQLSLGFAMGKWSEIHCLYNRYFSTIHQECQAEQLVPLEAGNAGSLLSGVAPKALENESLEGVPASNQIPWIESSPLEAPGFSAQAAGRWLEFRLLSALQNSWLSEHASRMTAMENGSNNSNELIARYATMKNRARQSSITNELTEITSGVEALKGKKT